MARDNRLIFLDTNILVDLIDGRGRQEKVLKYLSGKPIVASSILSISTAFYITQKSSGFTALDMSKFTRKLKVIDAGKDVLERAYMICADKDLEDAIQIATAIAGGAEVFITADKKLLQNYGHLLDIVLVV